VTDMKKEMLQGVIVPIITPIDQDEAVDEAAFRKHIRYLIEQGVQGLFAGGSAGEGPLLTMGEWQRMMEIIFDENRGRVFLLGGAIDTSTRRVSERIKILSRTGYKYFVVTPTFYLTSKTREEHLSFFGACKDAAGPMEMIGYNIPQAVGAEIAVETLCAMAERKWIRYCKESSGKLDYFKNLVAEGRKVGLKVFEGDELTMADGLQAGACGIVPVCANYAPQPFIEAYKAASAGDSAKLEAAHSRILKLREHLVLSGACWLSGIKYAVSTLGMGTGKPISPLPGVSEAQKKIIAALGKP
jgi:4-hydroxy-tetrahydrodipicolinate synthase